MSPAFVLGEEAQKRVSTVRVGELKNARHLKLFLLEVLERREVEVALQVDPTKGYPVASKIGLSRKSFPLRSDRPDLADMANPDSFLLNALKEQLSLRVGLHSEEELLHLFWSLYSFCVVVALELSEW